MRKCSDDKLRNHLKCISNIKISVPECIRIVQGAVISIFVLLSFDVIENTLPSTQGGVFVSFYLTYIYPQIL